MIKYICDICVTDKDVFSNKIFISQDADKLNNGFIANKHLCKTCRGKVLKLLKIENPK